MTEPTRVIAIRHGETAWNVDTRIQGQLDIPLSATGRWQAERLGNALRDEPITAIYASDLLRAWETAQYVSRATGVEVTREEALRERAIKEELKSWAKERGLPKNGWKIFETSGHPGGQSLAFSLLNHGAHLGVVGYTPKEVSVRLSNLMAFDATARGTWGCLPENYPAVVELVAQQKLTLTPFTERRPMSEINAVFDALHHGQLNQRPIMIPDFEGLS